MEESEVHNSPHFWDKSPEKLVKQDKLSELSSHFGVIAYFSGVFNYDLNCIIREFTSNIDNVRKIASKEQEFIRRTRTLMIRDNVLGYYFEEHEDSSTYILISKLFPTSLLNVLNESDDEKYRIFSRLANIVYKMNSQHMFYLLLNPKTIFLHNSDLILGDFFLSSNLDSNEDRKILFDCLTLAQNDYFSDEINLIKSGLVKNIEEITKIYRFSDLRSLGILLFFIFNFRLKDITFNDSVLFNHKYNFQLGNADYNTITSGEFFNKTNNLKLSEIAYSLVNNCFDHKYLFSCFNQNELKLFRCIETQSCIIFQSEFDEILEMFQSLQTDIFTYRLSSNIFCQRLKRNCGELLNKKYEVFQNAKVNFLKTPCFTEKLNAQDGIIYFVWVFLKDMNESDKLRNQFYQSIFSQENFVYFNYVDRLKSIRYYCPFLQDYILIGLTVQIYNRDWIYFFNNEILLTRLYHCYSLIYCENFFSICKKLFLNPKILEILSKYLIPESRISIYSIIIDHALPHTYIIPLQPTLHGLTTYNLNIFLNIYDAVSVEDAPPRYLVAWFLTLFHEMAHFLRRFNSSDFLESKMKLTPRADSDLTLKESLTDLTENLIHERNIRGEAGKEAEELLWIPQDFINDSAAIYFLKGKFQSPKFMDKIKRKNLDDLPMLGLSKHRGTVLCFRGRVCGVGRK